MRVLCYVLQRDNFLARDTGEICYEIFFHPLFTIDPNTTFILYTYTHVINVCIKSFPNQRHAFMEEPVKPLSNPFRIITTLRNGANNIKEKE